jgi:hypothetical protein
LFISSFLCLGPQVSLTPGGTRSLIRTATALSAFLPRFSPVPQIRMFLSVNTWRRKQPNRH